MTEQKRCPCWSWAYDPNAHGEWSPERPGHHPACDGAGNNTAFAWLEAPKEDPQEHKTE
jgi:hypothetical protein